MRRFTLALFTIALALPLTGAGAQIIRGGRFGLRDPRTWVSATYGWQEGWTVIDGSTKSRWDLGDTQQYGGSIERAVAGGVTVGVRAVTSNDLPGTMFSGIVPLADGSLIYGINERRQDIWLSRTASPEDR